MKIALWKKAVLLLGLWFWFADSSAFPASPGPDLLKAKKDAEAKGYIFEISRDEVVARAKKEGKLRAHSSMNPPTIKAMAEAFRAEYPFLDVQVGETTGTDTIQRFILEMKTGKAMGLDAVHVSTDFYDEYLPYLKQFDIQGMATHGALNIPTQ
ncbi:MAG: hypothetical protein HYY45_03080, partial [Deltaproteobacteria bacterium]|nr:hypothetical protein [Deltaproteobacteria bacterium]